MERCPYHPNENAHTIKKDGVDLLTCPECEWNPIDIGSDDGRTSPDIPTLGERLDAAEDDSFSPNPWGEQQKQIDYLERDYGDEEFDDCDLLDDEED